MSEQDVSEPPKIDQQRCNKCGAALSSLEKPCWLCLATPNARELSDPYAVAIPANYWKETASARYTVIDGLITLLLLGSVVLTILVAIGLSVNDSGLILPFLILVAPSFIATGVTGFSQWSHTGRAEPGKLLLTLFVSGIATIGVLGLLAVAGIVLLFIVCISQSW